MSRALPPLLSLLLIFVGPAISQAQTWGTTFSDGEYLVRVDQILAVSQHSYVVDGAAKVTEVNVSTASPVVVRYYYIDIIKPETPGAVGQSVINKVTEIAKEAAGRTVPSEIKVIKNYPTSTHAKTVEFRVSSAKELSRIYESAKRALISRNAETLKIE